MCPRVVEKKAAEMRNYLSGFHQKGSLKKDAVVTLGMTILGRGLGFFIPVLIATWFGTDQKTDAFFLAYAIWLFVTLAFGNVFETVVVPFVVEQRSQNKPLGRFVREILGKATLILAVIAFVLLLVVKPILKITTGFSPEAIALVRMLMIEMLSMIFLSLATDTINGVLNACKMFAVPALSPGFRSLVVILTVLLLKNGFGIHAIAWAYGIGEGVRFLVSCIYFSKQMKETKIPGQKTEDTASFFKCMVPQLFGLTFINLIFLVDQSMASWFGPGALTTYAYAERLRNVLFLLFSAGTGSVALSYWANQFGAKTTPILWPKIKSVIWGLFWLSAFFALGMVFFRFPLSTLLFKHGEFPTKNLHQVSDLFGILVMGVPFQVMALLGVRFLIVLKRNAFYMVIGFLRLILDAPLNYLFMHFIGINGIALSTTFLDVLFAFFIYQRMKAMIKISEWDMGMSDAKC